MEQIESVTKFEQETFDEELIVELARQGDPKAQELLIRKYKILSEAKQELIF